MTPDQGGGGAITQTAGGPPCEGIGPLRPMGGDAIDGAGQRGRGFALRGRELAGRTDLGSWAEGIFQRSGRWGSRDSSCRAVMMVGWAIAKADFGHSLLPSSLQNVAVYVRVRVYV